MRDEMNNESTVALPKALAALGTDDFLAILKDELYENADAFPLESCMENAGWPDTDSLELEVSNVTVKEESIYATVQAYFDEQTRHSGCADLEGPSYSYRGTFRLKIGMDDGEATIKLDGYEEEREDDGRAGH
jgi:hypothetical protein